MSEQELKPTHALTVYWLHLPQPVRLLFKSAETGNAMMQKLECNAQLRRTVISDDYGNTMLIALDSVSGICFTDLQREADGNRELQLFNAHAQIKMQKAAEADASIREHNARAARLAQITGGQVPPVPFRQ